MPHVRLPLELVSPAFTSGADPRKPELRVPTIRGQIRYWLRAYLGASLSDHQQVSVYENALLGSTGTGSLVTMRVRQPELNQIGEVKLVPHSKDFKAKALLPSTDDDIGGRFTLELSTPPGVPFPDEVAHAVSIWLLLGGVGKRSRRMFGAVQLHGKPKRSKGHPVNKADFGWWKLWSDLQQQPHLFREEQDTHMLITKHVLETHVQHTKRASRPTYPTLHPRYSRVIVGMLPFETAEEANRKLFDLLRKPKFREYEEMFGFAASDRRASPLIATVRRFDEAYYPVLTVMRSPLHKKNKSENWQIVDEFMDESETVFQGETVWGGHLA